MVSELIHKKLPVDYLPVRRAICYRTFERMTDAIGCDDVCCYKLEMVHYFIPLKIRMIID